LTLPTTREVAANPKGKPRPVPRTGQLTHHDLFHFRPHAGAHRVALRAGISVFVPLLAVFLLGHPEWSMYAGFGAFTSLYGRNHVHLSRAAMQASVGTVLVSVIVLGVAVSTLPHAAWVAVPIAGLVAAGASMLSRAQDWHPPGSLFVVFAFGGCASVPHTTADLAPALAVSGLSALFAVVVGAVGGFARGERSTPSRARLHRSWLPLQDAVAASVAGALATASGIGHPYWATVAAVAPLSARGLRGQVTRGIQRVLGTLLGLVTSGLLLSLHLTGVALLLVIAALQIGAELLVGRNYGIALLVITPLALLMGQTAFQQPAGQLLVDRGVETVIGSAVGLALVVGLNLHRRRRTQT
jgi:uncharacterized membrane protein YccC